MCTNLLGHKWLLRTHISMATCSNNLIRFLHCNSCYMALESHFFLTAVSATMLGFRPYLGSTSFGGD